MFWRTFIFAFLAVGAIAEKFQYSEEQRNMVKSKLTSFCKNTGGDAEEKAEQLTNSVESFYNCVIPLVDYDALKSNIEAAKANGTINDISKVKNTGGDAEEKAEQLTNFVESFYNCVIPLEDYDTLKSDIEAAKANGTINDVSKVYCAKAPEFKTCFHTLIDASSPCVESAEKQIPLAKNSTDQFFDYVCFNEGSRITQFVTENGPECVQSKTKEINICADTLQTQVDSSIEILLSLSLTEKCRKFDELTTCIFKSLETCPTPAPGNMLKSLITYMRKGSVCNDALPLPQ